MLEKLLMIERIRIGNRIREARERKNLTQMKLAELVNLSTITISNIESAKVSPNLKNIIMIAKVLDVSIDFLIADENSKLNELFIHEINVKLNRMDEIGLYHVNKYIELYNETEGKRINLISDR